MINEEYLSGVLACTRGEPCPVDADPDFEKGYARRYEIEQVWGAYESE